MPIICLGVFSIAETEAFLAKIWLRLERNGERTPRFRLKFRPDGKVGLWLDCPDPALAAGYVAVALGRELVGAAA